MNRSQTDKQFATTLKALSGQPPRLAATHVEKMITHALSQPQQTPRGRPAGHVIALPLWKITAMVIGATAAMAAALLLALHTQPEKSHPRHHHYVDISIGTFSTDDAIYDINSYELLN